MRWGGIIQGMKLILKFLVVVLVIMVLPALIPGISVEGFYPALIVALALGLLNLTLKPILFVVTLPINILTLGLFSFVINGLILWFVASFVDGFAVAGFWAAFLGALVVSAANWLISLADQD